MAVKPPPSHSDEGRVIEGLVKYQGRATRVRDSSGGSPRRELSETYRICGSERHRDD